jgi:hypothetical protein
LLQTNSGFRPVRFDNLIIQRRTGQRPLPGAGLPRTWTTTSTTNLTIERESNGNQYIRMKDDVALNPVMSPIRDLTFSCRLWSEQGGFSLSLRDNPGGKMRFDFVGGDMTLAQLDGAGGEVSATASAIYTRPVASIITFAETAWRFT